jgi:glycosyl transferase family 2
MKLVMTLLVNDEVDIIATQLDYHLSAGVDFVIAMDHNSVDGTTDVLRDYERRGVLRILPPLSEDLHMMQGEWVTSMARLAASEYGADWVINADADEFWYPRRGTLKDVFATVHPAYGVVRALMRHFVPRPAGPEPFFERMVARHRCEADGASTYNAQVKVAHRGVPEVEVARGNHDAYGPRLGLLREWIPLEVLHFPIRSKDQMLQKHRRRPVFRARHVDAVVKAFAAEGVENVWAGFLVDDERLQRDLESKTLAIDLRVRDALRLAQPGARSLTTYDELAESPFDAERAFVSDLALFMESDARIRLGGRIVGLEARLTSLGV